MESKRTRVGTLLAVGVVAVALIAVSMMAVFAIASKGGQGAAKDESASLEQNETMPNFFSGGVVQSEYEQGFFVGSPSPSQFPSGQGPTLLAVAPTVFPSASSASDVNPFYVLVPAWGCAGSGGGIGCGLVNALAPAYAASFAANETCLPATIQTCWDHPSTIGVPNSLLGGGAGFTIVPLPGHSHLIASLESNQDVWWNIMVVLVFNQAAWPAADASHGITSVANLTASPTTSGGFVSESLTQAELNGDVFGPVVTNTFLNFLNLPANAT